VPRNVSDIVNKFADKDGKSGTNPPMANEGVILDEPWLINGKYYPPSNYFNQPDDIELWWSYNHYETPTYTGYTWSYPPNDGTHYAGYQLNEAMWNDHEPKFRDGLKRMIDVLKFHTGNWSTSYDMGTLTRIARELDALENDLRNFVGTESKDGNTGLVKEFYKLSLPEEGGFQGTAAGALGNRIYELTGRLQDMYKQLENIHEPLSKIHWDLGRPDGPLEKFIEAAEDWLGDENTKVYNILYDWYHNTTSGTQTWNEERGQFQITINKDGVTGIVSDQDEQKEGVKGPTTTGILNELNRLWEEKFNDVQIKANAFTDSVESIYHTA